MWNVIRAHSLNVEFSHVTVMTHLTVISSRIYTACCILCFLSLQTGDYVGSTDIGSAYSQTSAGSDLPASGKTANAALLFHVPYIEPEWSISYTNGQCHQWSPSVLWHYRLVHLTRKIVPKMTCNVLNLTVPVHVPVYILGLWHRLLWLLLPRDTQTPGHRWLHYGSTWQSLASSKTQSLHQA